MCHHHCSKCNYRCNQAEPFRPQIDYMCMCFLLSLLPQPFEDRCHKVLFPRLFHLGLLNFASYVEERISVVEAAFSTESSFERPLLRGLERMGDTRLDAWQYRRSDSVAVDEIFCSYLPLKDASDTSKKIEENIIFSKISLCLLLEL